MLFVILILLAVPAALVGSFVDLDLGSYPPWVWPVAGLVVLSALATGGSSGRAR